MSTPTDQPLVTRRSLLLAGAVAVPVLVLPISMAACSNSPADFAPNAFLRIDSQGAITLALPKTEMGQSVYTAIAMLVAEELEVKPNAITVELPDGVSAGIGGLSQSTGGSTSMRETWLPLRQAAADARAALVAAAAALWKVPAAECRAEGGSVIHDPSKRSAPYGLLVAAAAAAPLPVKTPLKAREQFRQIGKPTHRLDAPAMVRGAATYGIDVVRPGMKVATLAQSPVIGGKLKSVEDAAALKVRGVSQVVRLPDAVAVVADTYWSARKGLDALAIEWDDGVNASLDQAAIAASYAKAAEKAGEPALKEGGLDANAIAGRMKSAASRVSAVYEQPFLAHAPMEPGSCVAEFRDGALEIWAGTQIPGAARTAAAKASGLPEDKVVLHNFRMGGGFGRRLEPDYVVRTVEVARQVRGPVKLVWSREEDMQHDWYRPYYVDVISAGLDADGKPIAWSHRVTGPSIIARSAPKYFKGVDADAVHGAIETPYTLPAQRVEYVRQESAVPTSWWRGVGGARSAFVVESFIDELAHHAKSDPVAYRRGLSLEPRAQAVLDLAAVRSGWPGAAGRACGISLVNLWGAYLSTVVEVERSEETGVRVTRVTAAIDCGQPINPLGIEAQIEGGIVFGLSAALFGEVTVLGGRIEQSNFHDYRVLRINETPQIAVYIVDSDQPPGGLGEIPVAAVMPALANAVFALTGRRVRRLPIAKALSTT